MPIDNYYSLFPCECVYAAIEVKSTLNASDGEKGPSGSIYECVQYTTRLKTLNRAKHNLPPIQSIVFAYETGWNKNQVDQVKDWFEKLGKKYSMNVPEVVFILEPSFVLTTSGSSGYNDQSELTHIFDRDPLLFFTSHLIHRLSETQVTLPNLWDEYINWQRGDVIVKIYRENM